MPPILPTLARRRGDTNVGALQGRSSSVGEARPRLSSNAEASLITTAAALRTPVKTVIASDDASISAHHAPMTALGHRRAALGTGRRPPSRVI